MANKTIEGDEVIEIKPYLGNRIAIFNDDTVTVYEYGKEPVTMQRADYKYCGE